MKEKEETKQVRRPIINGVLLFLCTFWGLKLLRNLCVYVSLEAEISESNTTLIAITCSLLFIAFLHFRGIFAAFSATEDEEETEKYINNLLKSPNIDDKSKYAITFFRGIFKANICVIAIYSLITLIFVWIPYELPKNFYLSSGSVILLMAVLLILGYFICYFKKLFPERRHTMKGETIGGKFILLGCFTVEIIMRVLCVVFMLYPIGYKLVPHPEILWFPIMILVWLFDMLYLILRDKLEA